MRLVSLFLVMQLTASAVIIDRIAVIVGNSIIKDSDIQRDLRVTDLLNNEPVDLSLAARKKAASRLIDQVFIRREIFVGDYSRATPQEARQQLDRLQRERFKTQAAFDQALKRYGVSQADVTTQFQWQLTVLRFIDARFKPAVLVTDDEIEKYYLDHRAALEREYPGKSADELRQQVRDIITGEKVNKQFFSWLDDQRNNINVAYREGDLQ